MLGEQPRAAPRSSVVAPDQRRQRLRDPGCGGRTDGERGRADRRRVERRVLGEDRRLQPAKLGSGFEAELLAEDVSALLEDPQRVGLPTGAVQREHQQPAEPLAQRMRGDELLELDDCSLVAAELELEVEPLLDRRRAAAPTAG